MRKATLLLAVLTVLFSACSKKGDNTPINQWTAGGATHQAATIIRPPIGFGLMAEDGSGAANNSVSFIFSGNPVNGSYKVVDFARAAGEVNIVCFNGGPTNLYRSTSADSRMVYVRVANDKISVFFNNGITLQPLLPTGGAIELSGALKEK